MQFDNRGSKVADPKKAAQILAAIADCVCNVPVSQVKYGGTIGQSTLLNHQSVSTFTCVGPTKTNSPVSGLLAPRAGPRRAARATLVTRPRPARGRWWRAKP
jgi:hypothetical protein